MSEGWVKLHRKFTKWEWFRDQKTSHLFLYCLLRANYEDSKWQGCDVPRGSFVTSIPTLSKETCLTVKEIRTALNKLKRTGELADKSNNKYRVISVTCYENYQDLDDEGASRGAGKGQAKGRQRATDKKNKKVKKEKNNYTYTPEFEKFWSMYGRMGSKERAFKEYQKLTKEQSHGEILGHLDRYNDYCASTDWYHKQHASTWLNGGWSGSWEVDQKNEQSGGGKASARQRWRERRGLGG